jgi:hypothetical protein
MLGKMSLDLLNLETLKFLTHFREPESSLYFIFISYILIFFFSFFHYTHTCFSSSLFLSFYLLPLNSKIALYLPPPPCLDVCSSLGKEVIEIR